MYILQQIWDMDVGAESIKGEKENNFTHQYDLHNRVLEQEQHKYFYFAIMRRGKNYQNVAVQKEKETKLGKENVNCVNV